MVTLPGKIRALPLGPALGCGRKKKGEPADPPFSSRSGNQKLPGSSDFAGFDDLREIAVAEVEKCPNDRGLVTLWRIEQLDAPLWQWMLW